MEDTTTLLLNLSQRSNGMRSVISASLVDGVRDLAANIQSQIACLMDELRLLNRRAAVAGQVPVTLATEPIDADADAAETPTGTAGPSTQRAKGGLMQDRFIKDTMVISSTGAAEKGPSSASQELQLRSMVPLITKSSSQSFLLNILKINILIRHSAQHIAKKFADEMDARKASQAAAAADAPAAEAGAFDATSEPTDGCSSAEPQGAAGPLPANAPAQNVIVLDSSERVPLSETLKLVDLWNTLSDCLVELEETADHHAVLILQPAV